MTAIAWSACMITSHDLIPHRKLSFFAMQIIEVCHATDGPPKIGPPGLSMEIFIATGGPLRQSMTAIDDLPGPSVAP